MIGSNLAKNQQLKLVIGKKTSRAEIFKNLSLINILFILLASLPTRFITFLLVSAFFVNFVHFPPYYATYYLSPPPTFLLCFFIFPIFTFPQIISQFFQFLNFFSLSLCCCCSTSYTESSYWPVLSPRWMATSIGLSQRVLAVMVVGFARQLKMCSSLSPFIW